MIKWGCFGTVYDNKDALIFHDECADITNADGDIGIISVSGRFIVARFFISIRRRRSAIEEMAEFPTLEDAKAAAELLV